MQVARIAALPQGRLATCSRPVVQLGVGSAARCTVARVTGDGQPTSTAEQPTTSAKELDLEREVTKFTRTAAGTFAPRSSTAKGKNPAVRGSVLYNIFEVQSWVALAAGGLLSFNIIWPTDEPSIARLLGMWSIWMFTIPSLRAKECTANEKDALNILFLLVPLMNVTLPLLWKSFPFIFVSDVVALVGVYWYKGVWKEIYGIPFEYPGAAEANVAAAEAKAAAAAAAAAEAASGNGEGSA